MSVKGLDFPLHIDSSLGHFARVSGGEKKSANVHRLLITKRGESVINPAFGLRTVPLLFGDMDAGLAALTETETRNAISRYEPRVSVVAVDVAISEESGSFYADVVMVDNDTGEIVNSTGKPG